MREKNLFQKNIHSKKKFKLPKNWNFEKIKTLTKINSSGKTCLLDVAGVYRILCFIHTVLYTLATTNGKTSQKR